MCLSLALCWSYACEHIPHEVEELVLSVNYYIRYSSNRLQKFQKLQAFLQVPEHRMLKLANTWWLFMKTCVDRVFKQCDTRLILCRLRNPSNDLFLKFLEFILPIVTDRNEEFQSEIPKVYTIYSQINGIFRTIIHLYFNPDYIVDTPLLQIQYRVPANFIPLEKIYLRPKVMVDFAKLSLNQKTKFLTKYLNFLVELCKQIYTPFPFNDDQMKGL